MGKHNPRKYFKFIGEIFFFSIINWYYAGIINFGFNRRGILFHQLLILLAE